MSFLGIGGDFPGIQVPPLFVSFMALFGQWWWYHLPCRCNYKEVRGCLVFTLAALFYTAGLY
jgi:hypothetical protein